MSPLPTHYLASLFTIWRYFFEGGTHVWTISPNTLSYLWPLHLSPIKRHQLRGPAPCPSQQNLVSIWASKKKDRSENANPHKTTTNSASPALTSSLILSMTF